MASAIIPAFNDIPDVTGLPALPGVLAVSVVPAVHCNENSIYVFPENELRGFSPNFHIHVFVSVLYIPRIGPHIFLQQNRQTDRGNI